MTKEENEYSINELESLRKIFTPGLLDGTVKLRIMKNRDVRITYPIEVDGRVKNIARILTGDDAAFIISLKNELNSLSK